MKKKLVIWSDFIVPTGFGNVAKNLFADLHKYYDVSVVAINYRGNQKYDTSKWFVYPTTGSDVFNTNTLIQVVKQEQPEVIILFQDSFNISNVIERVVGASPKSKIISYFPVDASYFHSSWKNIFEYSTKVIQYTKYSTKITGVDSDILYHGVDTDIFRPVNTDQIKKQFGWENKFILCNVNRFQPRKAVPLLIRAYSIFAKGGKNVNAVIFTLLI
jgi:glycosyltransferase involved in cell wall biosynthesis